MMKQSRNSKRIDKDSEAVRAVLKNEKKILDFNRQQMRSGKDNKGNFLTPYSIPYLSFKMKLSSYKAPVGIPDLWVTGELQNEMDLIADGKQYDIVSEAPHTRFVQNMYPNMFDLSPSYLDPARFIVTVDWNRFIHIGLNK